MMAEAAYNEIDVDRDPIEPDASRIPHPVEHSSDTWRHRPHLRMKATLNLGLPADMNGAEIGPFI